jgi:hypothetical protein
MFVAVHSSVLLYFALMLSPHYNNCIIPSLCCDRGMSQSNNIFGGLWKGAKKEPHIAKPHTATPLQWLRAVPPYKKGSVNCKGKKNKEVHRYTKPPHVAKTTATQLKTTSHKTKRLCVASIEKEERP